jgi:hypothetical protein
MVSALVPLALLIQTAPQTGRVQLNADICEGASRSYLIASLTIALVVAVLAVLLKRLWDRRQSWSPGVRTGLSIALAFILSSALVAWNPVEPQYYAYCLQSMQFSRFVLMANVAAIPKGLVLGGLVSVVFYLLITVLLNLLAGTRRR